MNLMKIECLWLHRFFARIRGSLYALIALGMFACVQPLHAAEILFGLGGDADLGVLAMGRNDDGTSARIDLGTGFPNGINFFGQTHTSLIINNNGNVTFNGGVRGYTPNPFPTSNRPMIAPYWGDVDTRRAASEPPFNNRVYYSTAIDGKFIVTWYYVGYYAASVDKLNTFQLVLTDRSDVAPGDFDVEFRYKQLQWTTGSASGGSGGLGGIPAQVGFDAGDKINFFQHPDSRTAEVLNFVNTSNVDDPGVWLFQVRSGIIEEPQNQLHDVTVKLTMSQAGLDIDQSSFTIFPERIEVVGSETVIEWFFPTFASDQVEDLDFNVIMRNPVPAEQRLITTRLELSYTDINGNIVRHELGQQFVDVMPSIFQIGVTTDKTTYSFDESVIVEALVSNLGEFETETTVRLSVKDDNGALVSELVTLTNTPLAAGENKIFTGNNFFTGSIYEGQYEVHAELLDVDGQVFAHAVSPFLITAALAEKVTATITTDKPAYNPLELVNILDRVRNVTPNANLEGIAVTTTIYEPGGAEFWTGSAQINQLLPNSLKDINYAAPLGRALPGQYRATLVVRDDQGVERALSETTFEVLSSADTGVGLIGNVKAIPGNVLKTEFVNLVVDVENQGNSGINNLPLSLSIVDPETEQVIAQWTDNVRQLSVQTTYSLNKGWQALGRVGSTYIAILNAEIGGETRALAMDSFTIDEKIESDIRLGDRGRLLVLLDGVADDGNTCSGVRDVELTVNFESTLSAAATATVELFDNFGTVIDLESITLAEFISPINDAIGTQGADLVVNDFSANGLTVSLNGTNTTDGLLGSDYQVVTTIRDQGNVLQIDSMSIHTSCSEPIALGDIHAAYEITGLDVLPLESIVVSDNDPHGPADAPSLSEQRAFLEMILQRDGWFYTIVTSGADFSRELRSGAYAQYLLLNEQEKIPTAVQSELREAVFRGEGLIEAGSHDQRSGGIDSALGIKYLGKYPDAMGITLMSSPIHQGGEEVFQFADKVLRIQLLTAKGVVDYTFVDSSVTDFAATTLEYGSGKSVYIGFDLLAQATVAGEDSLFVELLLNALIYTQPSVLEMTPGTAVPVVLSLTNHGLMVPGQVVISLPSGSEIVDPGVGLIGVDGHLTLPFKLAQNETIKFPFWVRLPVDGSTTEIVAAIKLGVNPNWIDYDIIELNIVPDIPPKLINAINALNVIIADRQRNKAYGKALSDLLKADAAISNGDIVLALAKLVKATDNLIAVDEIEADDIRVMVDHVIRSIAQRL